MTEEYSKTCNAGSAFIRHLHPRTVPAETLRFTLSFGLGGMAALLLAVLVGTGILQLLSYAPDAGGAHDSVRQMYAHPGAAGFIRNIHYWSGNLLVLIVFFHLLRVVLTGALSGGRQSNWLIGIALLLLVLFANFTGYLLPWDQRAYWAVTIFTSMTSYIPYFGERLTGLLRGGEGVGQPTLANFFAIHVGIIPFILACLAVVHFWLIRKAGGLIREAQAGVEEAVRLEAFPYLFYREAAVGLGLLALITLFSALFDAPLGSEAHPGISPNPVKAAWYFMGLQELLLHLHPVVGICIVPVLTVGALTTLPFIRDGILPAGRWFGGTASGRRAALRSLVGGTLLVLAAVLIEERMGDTAAAADAAWLYRGILPLAAALLIMAGWFAACRKRAGCSRAEAVTALVLSGIGAIVGLTVTGIWLRGPEMALTWPF